MTFWSQDDAPPTEPHRPGPWYSVLKSSCFQSSRHSVKEVTFHAIVYLYENGLVDVNFILRVIKSSTIAAQAVSALAIGSACGLLPVSLKGSHLFLKTFLLPAPARWARLTLSPPQPGLSHFSTAPGPLMEGWCLKSNLAPDVLIAPRSHCLEAAQVGAWTYVSADPCVSTALCLRQCPFVVSGKEFLMMVVPMSLHTSIQ